MDAAGYKAELVALSTFTFTARIRPRLEGLTDEEYRWEPVAGCWSLRPGPDGHWHPDLSFLTPEPAPFTTIAWRLWHLTTCYGQTRNATMLAVDPPSGFDVHDPAPGTAAEALAALDAAFAWWTAMLEAYPAEALAETLGPVGEQWADATRSGFVLHMIDEFIHHGAELGVLRDLYRAQSSVPAAPVSVLEAAASGRWADVRALLATGAAVDEVGEHGRTALHHAAASAPLDVVRALVDAGADPTARDEQFSLPPAGWARYFGRDDVAALLEPDAG